MGPRSADGRAGTQRHAQLRVRLQVTFHFFHSTHSFPADSGYVRDTRKPLKARHVTQYS